MKRFELELTISDSNLELFENDLWKDTRVLKLDKDSDRKTLFRYTDHQTSLTAEYQFITLLREKVSFNIPKIQHHSENYISFDYIAGTRAFNLLVDLYTLYQENKETVCIELGLQLLALLEQDLKEFQTVTSRPEFKSISTGSYPANQKMSNMFKLLAAGLNLTFPLEDLEKISDLYESENKLPFRDATPKNVILFIPLLYQRNFTSRSERLDCIQKLIKQGRLKEEIRKENIFHIDFSGCHFLCPKEDDWIALKTHECSQWLSSDFAPKFAELSENQLAVYFVRYARFGGRKLAYRLFNNNGYNVRFGLDNERLYFKALLEICNHLKRLGVLDNDKLAECISTFRDATSFTPTKDYFHNWKNLNSNFAYYQDVFPN